MQIFNLTNTLALLTFLAIFIPIYGDFKEKKKLVTSKIVMIIILGLSVLVLTVIKNNKDSNSSAENKKTVDSLNATISRIKQTSDSAITKLDTINLYVKRIDSLGFRRNPITNQPYKVIPANNSIQNVTSNNQKGGQTAGVINNH